jgi:SEC-C motif
VAGKIGRNDPCWCGSGRKYKYCHLNRANEPPVTIQEAIHTTKTISNKKYCLHPGANSNACRGGIVRAHTIQRSGGLTCIARDGHVYGFIPEPTDVARNEPPTRARLIGVKEASTFTGLCSYHDNQTFAPLEKQAFTGTQEQMFLLAYRTICNEAYAKRAQLEIADFSKTMDRGRKLEEQMGLQDFLNAWRMGIDVGLRELRHYKSAYDQALLNSDHSAVSYYALW